ncbi:hypothetical protein [Sandarakinorhabdus sp. AAP62]|uniref:hypothetical protein n=1 Tax=Sandarakinorhabdus sp. AAP62 TaxID=1248916 RepID=UPI00035DB695|nr:hypothetical protein [Sandarakinorhabdus sp. AAP62]
MAAPSSKPAEAPAEATPLAQFAERLAQRRAALGKPELPRNTGTRRTKSKQALLAAITKAGGDW